MRGIDMKIFNAKIQWLTVEQGGRKELPFGNQYAPIIRIIKPFLMPKPWLDTEGAWSLFVESKKVISDSETISEVKYLSEKAPNNLDKDVEFELYEGRRLIAKGIIL
jgi:hypothetical protein